MVIGTLASMGNGAMFPLVMLFFTGIIDEFSAYGKICDPALLPNITGTREDLYGPLVKNMQSQALNLVCKYKSKLNHVSKTKKLSLISLLLRPRYRNHIFYVSSSLVLADARWELIIEVTKAPFREHFKTRNGLVRRLQKWRAYQQTHRVFIFQSFIGTL